MAECLYGFCGLSSPLKCSDNGKPSCDIEFSGTNILLYPLLQSSFALNTRLPHVYVRLEIGAAIELFRAWLDRSMYLLLIVVCLALRWPHFCIQRLAMSRRESRELPRSSGFVTSKVIFANVALPVTSRANCLKASFWLVVSAASGRARKSREVVMITGIAAGCAHYSG